MTLKNIAFLGPQGTYTELALQAFLSAKESSPCYSIREVFDQVASGSSEAGFVPIENVLEGPVTETLDCLFEYKNRVFIASGFVMPIRHAIGTLGKIEPGAVSEVYSHPQALRQCTKYLQGQLKKAIPLAMASTGEAAQKVKSEKLTKAAVIAPLETLKDLGFFVLAEDISDSPGNRTRFVLLKKGDIAQQELAKDKELSKDCVTSIAIDPGRDRQGLLFDLLEVISVSQKVNLSSIHSRPDGKGGFVFHFDLEGHRSEPKIEQCLTELKKFCVDETGQTVELTLFGSYQRDPFAKLPFERICIIGGKGKMGQWFQRFFQNAGLDVTVVDTDGKLSLDKALADADVILLSLPMSAIAEVTEKIAKHLKPGQLVVENCSIKHSALPHLEEKLPKGVEALGLHTMFGADRETIRGENVIVTKSGRSKDKAQGFEDILYKHGAILSPATPEEHDKASAYVQSLTQFALVAMAEVLRKTFDDPEQLELFSTPNYRRVFESMQRVLNQNEDLLSDLQTLNPESATIRRRFLETVFRLVSELNADTPKAFSDSATASRKFLNS